MTGIAAGQTVSHYRVAEKLGGGGMGVVHRAEDVKLRRSVALKFLPADLTGDDEAKRRFIIEAQAASALDHPNICTIYEVDETPDGQLFLAMAYYEGETLKKKIARGPLTIVDALDIAIQIGQGLGKAHAADIVHRDVKPANVLLTTDGFAKLLDFGVAKLLRDPGLTRTGAAIGTIPYMSPEQLHGDAVDHRIDIWAMGVVLYEMLTGVGPFIREDSAAVSLAILRETPTPPSARRTGVPLELERIVMRALKKRREDRYQTVADLVSELRRLKRETDGYVEPLTRDATAVVRQGSRGRRAALVIAAVAVVAAVVAFALRDRGGTPVLTNTAQLTSATGVQDLPTWAPDGRSIAFVSNESGNFDIWVRPVGSSQAVNRTADFPGSDLAPSWSPDGQQIAFWSAREGGAYFVMSALGGAPKKVLATGLPSFGFRFSAPAWSEDGSALACVVLPNAVPNVEVVSLATGESNRLPLPGTPAALRTELSWSRDGKFFAYIDGRDTTSQVTQLWVLRRSDGKAAAITGGRTNVQSPSWSRDGRTLYFVSNRGGSMDLWQQRLDDVGTALGEPVRITTGIGMLRAAFSPDGSKLAYSRGGIVTNVWIVPILADRPATWADAKQLTFDEANVEFVDVSPDGQRLLVSSDKTGNPDLWSLPADGGEMQQVTNDSTPDWLGRFSPDGRTIGFYSYRSGARDLWVMPADSGRARQLTNHQGDNYFAGWSPDGRSVITYSNRSGKNQIWEVPIDGGPARRVTNDTASDNHPSWSPDGKWIVYASTVSGVTRLYRIPAHGGEPVQLTTDSGWVSRWSPDSKYVYFTTPPGRRVGGGNIWSVSVPDGIERQMTDLTGQRGRMTSQALATDGRRLFFSWGEELAHIWVADVISR
jgi:eukaryotic-like serine/threonine-protein kinase